MHNYGNLSDLLYNSTMLKRQRLDWSTIDIIIIYYVKKGAINISDS